MNYYKVEDLDVTKMRLEKDYIGPSNYCIVYNDQVIIATFDYEQHAKNFLTMLQEKGNKEWNTPPNSML